MNIRTGLTALMIGAGVLLPAAAESSFSAGVGTNLFRYEQTYLMALQATYLHALESDLELNIGSEFDISTAEPEPTEDNENPDTEPRFLIPVNIGLNFTFPQDRTTFLFGAGLSPVFDFRPNTKDEFQFLMGPYVKTELRVQVHPIMSWFLSAQQDLLIGGDDWINNATRLTTGINFALPSGERDASVEADHQSEAEPDQ